MSRWSVFGRKEEVLDIVDVLSESEEEFFDLAILEAVGLGSGSGRLFFDGDGCAVCEE